MRVQRHKTPGKDYEPVDPEEELVVPALNKAIGTPHPQALVDEKHSISPGFAKTYHLKLIEDSAIDLKIETSDVATLKIQLMKGEPDAEPCYNRVIEVDGFHTELELVSEGEHLFYIASEGDNECEVDINLVVTPTEKLTEKYSKGSLKKFTSDSRLPWSEKTIALIGYNSFIGIYLWSLGDLGTILFLGLYVLANLVINPIILLADIRSSRKQGPFPSSDGYRVIMSVLSALPVIGIGVAALHTMIRSTANKYIEPY